MVLNWIQLSKTLLSARSDDVLIEEVGRRLAAAVPARSRVVLFGSRARGDDQAHSDLDVLVIEPSVEDPMQESVRLRRLNELKETESRIPSNAYSHAVSILIRIHVACRC